MYGGPDRKIPLLMKCPFVPGDVSLPENSYQKIHADPGPVGIGNSKNEIATDHVRVFPAVVRAVRTKGLQSPNLFDILNLIHL